jgi:hypothetical protein
MEFDLHSVSYDQPSGQSQDNEAVFFQSELDAFQPDEVFAKLGLSFDEQAGWCGLEEGVLTNDVSLNFLDERDLLLTPGDFDKPFLDLSQAVKCPSTTGTVFLNDKAIKILSEEPHPIYALQGSSGLLSLAGEADLGRRAEDPETEPIYEGVAAVKKLGDDRLEIVNPNPDNTEGNHVLIMRQINTDSNLAAMLLRGEPIDPEAVAEQILQFRQRTQIVIPEKAAEFYGGREYLAWLLAKGTPLDFLRFKPKPEAQALHDAAAPHILDFIRRVDWAVNYDQDLIKVIDQRQGPEYVAKFWGDEKLKNSFWENNKKVGIDTIWLVFTDQYMQQVPGCENWQGLQLCAWPFQRRIQAHAYPRTLALALNRQDLIEELDNAYERHYQETIEGGLKRWLDIFTAYYQVVESVLRICWPQPHDKPVGWEKDWNDLVSRKYPQEAGKLIKQAIPNCPDKYYPKFLKDFF